MERPMVDRFSELLGIMLVGDGVVAMMRPRRHMRLWTLRAPGLHEMAVGFERRPGLTRAVAAAEIAAGLWLAGRALRE